MTKYVGINSDIHCYRNFWPNHTIFDTDSKVAFVITMSCSLALRGFLPTIFSNGMVMSPVISAMPLEYLAWTVSVTSAGWCEERVVLFCIDVECSHFLKSIWGECRLIFIVIVTFVSDRAALTIL